MTLSSASKVLINATLDEIALRNCPAFETRSMSGSQCVDFLQTYAKMLKFAIRQGLVLADARFVFEVCAVKCQALMQRSNTHASNIDS
jgi:hypothetical protein